MTANSTVAVAFLALDDRGAWLRMNRFGEF
jgi:hypothetical protein